MSGRFISSMFYAFRFSLRLQPSILSWIFVLWLCHDWGSADLNDLQRSLLWNNPYISLKYSFSFDCGVLFLDGASVNAAARDVAMLIIRIILHGFGVILLISLHLRISVK